MTASVIWTGRVARAELAVPCPTCNVALGLECDAAIFTDLPHRERALRAEVFGFRDVHAPGGLFADRGAQRVPMLAGDI